MCESWLIICIFSGHFSVGDLGLFEVFCVEHLMHFSSLSHIYSLFFLSLFSTVQMPSIFFASFSFLICYDRLRNQITNQTG